MKFERMTALPLSGVKWTGVLIFLLCVTETLFKGSPAEGESEATAEGEMRSDLPVLRDCSINILNPSGSFQVFLYLLASLKTFSLD